MPQIGRLHPVRQNVVAIKTKQWVAIEQYRAEGADQRQMEANGVEDSRLAEPCLLYTSDAADERSSVDLGGRRIIKKKTKDKTHGSRSTIRHYKHTIMINTYICIITQQDEETNYNHRQQERDK